MKSLVVLIVCWLILVGVTLFYYPKWKLPGPEATISWDVSGYYLYLPATFIYKDLRKLSFLPDILKKYNPTIEIQQASPHPNGNYVMLYSCGQALMYLPAFSLAHAYASLDKSYPADGFSRPYQLGITLGSLLFALLGLLLTRRNLLTFFSDESTALALFCIALGTNYFEYTATTGAMTHGYLFTLYAALIYFTIKFYRSPAISAAIGIGACIGLSALTRPTEILTAIIPLLWGLDIFEKGAIGERWDFFKKHRLLLYTAIGTCLLIGSLQLVYWKYVTGSWLYYSYGQFGFSWLKPHILDGLFSYNNGWLVYTPMMFFAIGGMYLLHKERTGIFWTIWIFICLFIYVAFAWDIWWYGGSLGQRTMVQTYAILAFPLTAFFQRYLARSLYLLLISPVLILFIYLNIWWSHQAHKGGMFMAEQMNKHYFWRVLGKWERKEEDLKLLDNRDAYTGTMRNPVPLFEEYFESDTVYYNCAMNPIEGKHSLCLNAERKKSLMYLFPVSTGKAQWVRVYATFQCLDKEYNVWNMTQFIVGFYDRDQGIKQRFIRVQRFLPENGRKALYLDIKIPKRKFDKIGVQFWNVGTDLPLLVDEMRAEAFEEQ